MDIADTEKIVNRVADREIDVGIVGGWINSRKIEGYSWLEDELVLIVPESHRLAQRENSSNKGVKMTDLLHERWIFREKGSGTRKAAEELLLSNGIRNEALIFIWRQEVLKRLWQRSKQEWAYRSFPAGRLRSWISTVK
jgi:DNA-binding transcriptional LysR family regulator